MEHHEMPSLFFVSLNLLQAWLLIVIGGILVTFYG